MEWRCSDLNAVARISSFSLFSLSLSPSLPLSLSMKQSEVEDPEHWGTLTSASSLKSLDADNSFVTEVVTEVSFVRPCDQMNSSNLNRRVLPAE